MTWSAAAHLVCLLYVWSAGRRVFQERAARCRIHVRRLPKELVEKGAPVCDGYAQLSCHKLEHGLLSATAHDRV